MRRFLFSHLPTSDVPTAEDATSCLAELPPTTPCSLMSTFLTETSRDTTHRTPIPMYDAEGRLLSKEAMQGRADKEIFHFRGPGDEETGLTSG
jgi:hypothetical protein